MARRAGLARRTTLALVFAFTSSASCVLAAGTPSGAQRSAAAAASVVRVKVGDSRIRGLALRPYLNEWRVTVRNAEGRVLPLTAKWSDELRVVHLESTDFLQRTQRAEFLKDGKVVGTTETVNVFDRRTMAPRSRHFVKHASVPGQEEDTTVDFQGLSVHWKQTTNGKTDDETVELKEPVFDFYGGLYGILFAALPLRRGLSVELPSLDESGPRATTVVMTVSGEEEIDAGHLGRRRAWLVESDTALGPMKLWLAREAPYILRLEYTAKDNGLTWTYNET